LRRRQAVNDNKASLAVRLVRVLRLVLIAAVIGLFVWTLLH
jgi:hypothetical protein